MCGASSQQTQTYNEQQLFYQNAMQQQQEAWGQDQDILAQMRAVYAPIFQKGPSQEGFSPEEKATLNTQVTEGTAADYAQAAQAINQKLAAQGGGNIAIPSGASSAIQADVATSAAQQEASQRLGITQASYAQGYQNWLNAAAGMGNINSALNPVAYSGAATNAGNSAATTANEITQANNSWINAAIGAAGAIGGGMASGGFFNQGGGGNPSGIGAGGMYPISGSEYF